MANPSKSKGDRAERDYVAHVVATYPNLVRPDAMRHLGAGRKDDIGDVRVFYDASVQVKHWGQVSAALIDAARTAVEQRHNGREPFGVGIVKLPYARPPKPVWIACTLAAEWLGEIPSDAPVFRMSGKLLTWIAASTEPASVTGARAAATTKAQLSRLPPAPVADPAQRIARWVVGEEELIVSPEVAWVSQYESARSALTV